MKINYLIEQFNLFENYKLARQEFSEFASPSEIENLFNEFKRISGRISDPKQKDINYWRKQGYSSFKKFVDELTNVQSKRERNREVKSASKDILTVKKTNNMHLFMPLSEEASCFYGYKGDGKGGDGWCISTKSGQNYFYQYTKHNNSYIFFLIHDDNVYALVMDAQGDMKECQDHKNHNSFPPETFFNIAGVTKDDLITFIISNKSLISSKITDSYDNKQRSLLETPKAQKILREKDPVQIMHYLEVNRISIRWPEAEPYIIKDPKYAMYYISNNIQGPWPEAEQYIMKDPKSAVIYNMNYRKVDEKFVRWPEAESYIMKAPQSAVVYAEYVLKQRWPEAEPYIMKEPFWIIEYALDVIKGRWSEAEDTLRENDHYWNKYKKALKIQ